MGIGFERWKLDVRAYENRDWSKELFIRLLS